MFVIIRILAEQKKENRTQKSVKKYGKKFPSIDVKYQPTNLKYPAKPKQVKSKKAVHRYTTIQRNTLNC